MSILSVGLGQIVALLPKGIAHYSSIVLFLVFGLKLIYDAYQMDGGSLANVEQEACGCLTG
jgi:putative Ca2+/H+ antiporter (TMEM165/GDT1 family)